MIIKYTEEEILVLRDRIVVEAKKLLNVPYYHRGRTRFGIDCLGLPWLAYRKAGIDYLPDNDGGAYAVHWQWTADKDRYLSSIMKYFDETDSPLRADLIMFKPPNEHLFVHGGIYIDNEYFIHARSGRKVMLDNTQSHRFWNKCSYKYLIFKGFV